MAETAHNGPIAEILGNNKQEIENQFLLDEQNEVELSTRDDIVRKNIQDAKKIQNRLPNLNLFEKIEQGGPRVESQIINNLPKNNQNVSKSKPKNKNIETQTINKVSQVKKRLYNLSKLSIPQNCALRSLYKTAQMSPITEANPKQLLDPLFLEERIKQIAKNIRNKVKKDSSMDRYIEQSSRKKVIKTNGRELKLNPLRQSPPLLVQKNNNLTINAEYEVLQTKLLTFDQSIAIDPNPKKIVKNIITKLILQKLQKQIQTRERSKIKKLKLDPIKHHYPITSFRKSIIEEIKMNTLRESQKQKERQAKLSKRRDMYNSSRYQRYAKFGYFLQRDSEEHKIKGEKTIILLAKVNPEADQALVKMREQASAITQIDSLIQFVNNSDVKVQQEKQSQLERESACFSSLDNIRV